ncbi:MAG: hypothetical protein R3F13_02375 [Prosthecobacter sp.]
MSPTTSCAGCADRAQVKTQSAITGEVAHAALAMRDIDETGL